MRFEVLLGLPPYGPMALSFSIHGAREHREGLVVRFYPKDSEPWVGNFIGGETACTVVLDHPNETDVILVTEGDAYVVDPERRAVREHIASFVAQVFPLPSFGLVLFQGSTDFIAIKADNSGWRSPRISWDGLRNIRIQGSELRGEAFTPAGQEWVPFRLNLLTGDCFDGIYEKEMGRAVRIDDRER